MKIWLLNPPFLRHFSRPQRSPAVTKSGTVYFPIWLASATGVLQQAGHEAVLIDAPAQDLSAEAVLEKARAEQPAFIVLDTSTPSIEHDAAYASRLKEVVPGCFIAMVGTHVSAVPDDTFGRAPAVDAIARREYDHTIRDLAALLASTPGRAPDPAALARIEGLSFRRGAEIVHNPDRPFIEDLDALPWVSRIYKQFLRIGDYFNPNALFPMVTLATSRGCAFRCRFCVYPQVLTGRAYRFRSVKDVVDEMAYVREAFPEAKSIFFEDDTLTGNKKRCLELADTILARGLKMPWTANSRIEVDLETLQRIRASGCRQLCVGFESGDQDVLDGMKKGTRVERMERFVQDARKAGILVHGCFIVGFPGETAAQMQKTLDLALRLHPDTAQFYPVMVYPGTESYEDFRAQGWLQPRAWHEWLTPEGMHNCVVRNKDFTPEQLVAWCDNARRAFYLRPGYLAFKLGQVIRHPSNIGRTLKAAKTFAKHLATKTKT